MIWEKAIWVGSARSARSGLEGEFLEYVMQGRAGDGGREPEPEQQAAQPAAAAAAAAAAGEQLIFCTFHHLLAGMSHVAQ